MAVEVLTREIPVISLDNFDARRDAIKDQLVKAAEELGFFSIVDHGISYEDIEDQFSRGISFFEQPDEIKKKMPHTFKLNAGYEERSQFRPSTGTIDQKESLVLRPGSQYGWPSEEDMPLWSAKTWKFVEQCAELSMKILDLFEEALGLPKGTFREAHKIRDETCLNTFRQLHYLPKGDTTGPYWRNGPHADVSILTLLFQRDGEPGLEICPGREALTDYGIGDTWTAVPAKQGPIICNIGDMMMYWSDDKYKSIFHRVVAQDGPEPSRRSMAYFNHAMKDVVIQGPEKKYPAMTADEIMKKRMSKEFAIAMAKDNITPV